MTKEKFKEKLENKDLDRLIKLFCEYFNINHVALDIMYLVEDKKLKDYIINTFVYHYNTFIEEEIENIIGGE